MLRPEYVERKLHLIADELDRLGQFADIKYDELIADEIRLAAIERILERIVVRAIDVNEHLIASLSAAETERTTRLTYRDSFLRLAGLGVLDESSALQIASSAGLRNILVHEYNDLDHRILHAAIPTALQQYYAYVKSVRQFVDSYSR